MSTNPPTTPRTDAMTMRWHRYAEHVVEDGGNVVYSDFARALERELAAVTAERDALKAHGRQPIETAPKGKDDSVALWCASAKSLFHTCEWRKGGWRAWGPDEWGNDGWQKLEPYEIPTHWLRIVPPAALNPEGTK